jgi:hypothetical protein
LAVFVLDKTGKALMPCTEKRAKLLLARGRARVHRVSPFVIRLRARACKALRIAIASWSSVATATGTQG